MRLSHELGAHLPHAKREYSRLLRVSRGQLQTQILFGYVSVAEDAHVSHVDIVPDRQKTQGLQNFPNIRGSQVTGATLQQNVTKAVDLTSHQETFEKVQFVYLDKSGRFLQTFLVLFNAGRKQLQPLAAKSHDVEPGIAW